jgi:hypothetical protein
VEEVQPGHGGGFGIKANSWRALISNPPAVYRGDGMTVFWVGIWNQSEQLASFDFKSAGRL